MMPQAPGTFQAPWAPVRTKEERRRDDDARRAVKHPWRYWYKLKGWLSIRARRLAAEPLCRMCSAKGLVVAATIVDHIIPHKGNRKLFFSYDNTQSLCETCHNRDKQREERAGIIPDRNTSDQFDPGLIF